MVGIAVRVIVNAIALWVTTLIVTEISFGSDPSVGEVVLVAAVFGLVNALIRPILKLLTLPLTIMTLGLFGIVVNGVLLVIVAWLSGAIGLHFTVGGYPPDFGVDTIIWGIVGAVVLGAVQALLGLLPLPGDRA